MPSFVTPPLQKVRPSPLALYMTKQPHLVETHKTKKKSKHYSVPFGKTKLYIKIMNDYADIFGLLCVIESMSSSVTPPTDKVRPSPLALNMMKQLRRVGTHNTKEKPTCRPV